MSNLPTEEVEEVAKLLHESALTLEKRADKMLDIPSLATSDRAAIYQSLFALSRRLRSYAEYLDLWVVQTTADDDEGSRF